MTRLAGNTVGQPNTQEALVGQWTLVSLKAERDGHTFDAFGPNPTGILIFDAQGRFATQVMRADLPKFAANHRLHGTPEENKAIVSGFIAYFGTYNVSEPGTVILRIAACSYPNFNGVVQKRTFAVDGDEMRYVNPTTSFDACATLTWKRAPAAAMKD